MKRNLLTSMFVIGVFTGVNAQSIVFSNTNEPSVGATLQTKKLDVTNFAAYTQVNATGNIWDYNSASLVADPTAVDAVLIADAPAGHPNGTGFPGTNLFIQNGPVATFLKTSSAERISMGVYYDDLVAGNPIAIKYNAPGQKLMNYPFSANQITTNTVSGTLSVPGLPMPVNYTGAGTVRHDGQGVIKFETGIIEDVTRVVYKDSVSGTTIFGNVVIKRVTIEYYKNGEGDNLPIFIESNVKLYIGGAPDPSNETSSAEIDANYTSYLSTKSVSLFELSVSPNPSNGELTIKGDFASAKVNVVDVQGKEVLVKDIQVGDTLNINQGAGVYFVTVTTERGSQTQKVVIN